MIAYQPTKATKDIKAMPQIGRRIYQPTEGFKEMAHPHSKKTIDQRIT